MINKEYLNHSFGEAINNKRFGYDYYICMNCNIKVYYNITFEVYYYQDKDWKKLNLNCEEWIIKNIIE